MTPNPRAPRFPKKAAFLFEPKRYKVCYGGRGGCKSWSIARALVWLAKRRKLRILCVRELQTSISESVHRLLSDQIHLLGYDDYFQIQKTSIVCLLTGSEFIFEGIRNNTTKIKSMEGIDICWAEEAEVFSEDSWLILTPTIRKEGSEIWVSFNPHEESDPTYKRFITNPPPNCISMEFNWRDNPWFSDEMRRDMEHLARVDHDAYQWVWEGKCLAHSNARIFADKCEVRHIDLPNYDHMADLALHWDGPYYGADWGFAQDPTVLLKSWISPGDPVSNAGRYCYIEKEAYKVGLELDDTPAYWKAKIPECYDRVIRADSSRPETISYVARHGNLQVIAAEKWPGSVEDGIAYFRSFEKIIIDPECRHSIEEARLYSYKVDRLTGDVLADIVDKHNHCWDAGRYGHEPMIMASSQLGCWSKL